MEQFKIEPLIPIHIGDTDISYTNSAFFMTLAVVASFLLFFAATRQRTMVPGRLQSLAEILYEFNAGLIKDNVGQDGMKYMPFVFTLFLFILLTRLHSRTFFFNFCLHFLNFFISHLQYILTNPCR